MQPFNVIGDARCLEPQHGCRPVVIEALYSIGLLSGVSLDLLHLAFLLPEKGMLRIVVLALFGPRAVYTDCNEREIALVTVSLNQTGALATSIICDLECVVSSVAVHASRSWHNQLISDSTSG